MPTSPLSTAEEARRAIAADLTAIRLDAGLTKRQLAAHCGWHESKSSRIEATRTVPSDDDIRAWCAACGVPAKAADIIASNRTAGSMYRHWRNRHAAGMRHAQEGALPRYESTSAFRIYCSNIVPGVLQTAGYATDLMTLITRFQGTPDDVEEAVQARMERGKSLYQSGHTFAILVEQSVLYYQPGRPETMAGQLGRLLEVMALPAVSLGVVPWSARRGIWPLEAFYVFDDRLVVVETLTAEINVQQPSEVGDYLRAFAELSKGAVYGAAARALITGAIDSIG
jgi:transcriptional regulator with XRE-family HTH domain